MAQTTSLVFNGGVIPSPSPAPSGNGKAKLLKIGEITVTKQEVQVTKNVLCDPDSVTTVAPFMEVLTSARLAELVQANNILVLDNGTMQYLMSDASIAVEDGTSVCTAVNFLGLSKENRAKVLYPCTRLTDELTLQQVIEVGEPVETGFDLVKAYPEDTEAGALIDKLEIEDTIDDDPDYQPLLAIVPADGKVAINEDGLHEVLSELGGGIDNIVDTISEMDMDSVPHAYLHSSLNHSAGDSTATRTTVDIFACNGTPEGDCFEFEQTTTIDDTPYGYLWVEPGTYLINGSVTLQWVGDPQGTFVAKVGSVMGENFDFSQEQEILRNHTKIVTIPNRMKLAINITYDAGTPVMGFWIQSLQVVKLAGGMSQTNIAHDSTLVGQGSVANPLGVDEAKVAQSTLAGNLAPAFDPTRTEDTKYLVGQSCVQNGVQYVFRVEHWGPWDSSHVTRVPASENFPSVVGFVGVVGDVPNVFYADGRLHIESSGTYVSSIKRNKYLTSIEVNIAIQDQIYFIVFNDIANSVEVVLASNKYLNSDRWLLGCVCINSGKIKTLQMFGKYKLDGIEQYYDPSTVVVDTEFVSALAFSAYSKTFSSDNYEFVSTSKNGVLDKQGLIENIGGSDCHYSDFLPLNGNLYSYFGGVYPSMANFAYYSEASEDSFIKSVTSTITSSKNNGRTYDGYIPLVEGAKYIRVAWNSVYEDGSFVRKHTPLNLLVDSLVEHSDPSSRFYGKKAFFLGDSITIGSWNAPGGWVNMDKPYPYWVGRILGMEVENYGIGGTHVSSAYTSTDGSNPNQAFTKRYESMGSDADFIFVMGGTNDWLPQHVGTAPIGSPTDNTDVSFYGAIDVLCRGLLLKYLAKEVIFITPISNSRQDTPNPTTNCDLRRYSDIIKEVCARYSIQVIDATTAGPFHFNVYTEPYCSDGGTHPNPDGQKILGEYISRKLLTI